MSEIKKIIFSSLFILYFIIGFNSTQLNGQIGIEIIGVDSKFNEWDKLIDDYANEDYNFFDYEVGGGINYWFRLKEYRVEFTPGFYYLYSKFKYDNPSCSYEYHYQSLGTEFDINLYPFDFMRRTYEKDCPSFNNRGQWFSKSFFFQFSPGLYVSKMDLSGKDIIDYDMAGKFDFGIGVDMKLSNHILLAPILKYGFLLGQEWKGLGDFHGEPAYNEITSGNFLSFTLSFYLK
ncbi:MAG: hypothetical protein R2771_09795 [Saprospiraceae bacterium]